MKGHSAIKCVFCRMEETYTNKGEKALYPIDHEAKSFVCSSCIQAFVELPHCKLIKAFHLAKDKGYSDKIQWLESFIMDDMEDLDDNKTGDIGSDLVRERALPKARLARRRIRRA